MICAEQRVRSGRANMHGQQRYANAFCDSGFMDETDREVSSLTDRAFRSLCIGEEAIYNDSECAGHSAQQPSAFTEEIRTFQKAFAISEDPYGATFPHGHGGGCTRPSNGAMETEWQQRRSSPQVSSLIKSLNITQKERGMNFPAEGPTMRDCQYREANQSQSWDRSALLSIQSELSEFSAAFHLNLKASNNKTKAQRFRKLSSVNFFLHSESSPFQTWQDYNRPSYRSERPASPEHLSTGLAPHWYDSPLYKQLAAAAHGLQSVQSRDKKAHQLQPACEQGPSGPSRPGLLHKASSVEKRCESEMLANGPPWRRRNMVSSKLTTHRPCTVSPSSEKLRGKDQSLFSTSSRTSGLTHMVHTLQDKQPSHSSTPFCISQLLTPAFHTRPGTDSSDVLQHSLSPAGQETSSLKENEQRPRASYKSMASSLLFNLKDNRKRVKSTYSPSKFRSGESTKAESVLLKSGASPGSQPAAAELSLRSPVERQKRVESSMSGIYVTVASPSTTNTTISTSRSQAVDETAESQATAHQQSPRGGAPSSQFPNGALLHKAPRASPTEQPITPTSAPIQPRGQLAAAEDVGQRQVENVSDRERRSKAAGDVLAMKDRYGAEEESCASRESATLGLHREKEKEQVVCEFVQMNKRKDASASGENVSAEQHVCAKAHRQFGHKVHPATANNTADEDQSATHSTRPSEGTHHLPDDAHTSQMTTKTNPIAPHGVYHPAQEEVPIKPKQPEPTLSDHKQVTSPTTVTNQRRGNEPPEIKLGPEQSVPLSPDAKLPTFATKTCANDEQAPPSASERQCLKPSTHTADAAGPLAQHNATAPAEPGAENPHGRSVAGHHSRAGANAASLAAREVESFERDVFAKIERRNVGSKTLMGQLNNQVRYPLPEEERKAAALNKETPKAKHTYFSFNERDHALQEMLTTKLKEHAQKEIFAIKGRSSAKRDGNRGLPHTQASSDTTEKHAYGTPACRTQEKASLTRLQGDQTDKSGKDTERFADKSDVSLIKENLSNEANIKHETLLGVQSPLAARRKDAERRLLEDIKRICAKQELLSTKQARMEHSAVSKSTLDQSSLTNKGSTQEEASSPEKACTQISSRSTGEIQDHNINDEIPIESHNTGKARGVTLINDQSGSQQEKEQEKIILTESSQADSHSVAENTNPSHGRRQPGEDSPIPQSTENKHQVIKANESENHEGRKNEDRSTGIENKKTEVLATIEKEFVRINVFAITRTNDSEIEANTVNPNDQTEREKRAVKANLNGSKQDQVNKHAKAAEQGNAHNKPTLSNESQSTAECTKQNIKQSKVTIKENEATNRRSPSSTKEPIQERVFASKEQAAKEDVTLTYMEINGTKGDPEQRRGKHVTSQHATQGNQELPLKEHKSSTILTTEEHTQHKDVQKDRLRRKEPPVLNEPEKSHPLHPKDFSKPEVSPSKPLRKPATTSKTTREMDRQKEDNNIRQPKIAKGKNHTEAGVPKTKEPTPEEAHARPQNSHLHVATTTFNDSHNTQNTQQQNKPQTVIDKVRSKSDVPTTATPIKQEALPKSQNTASALLPVKSPQADRRTEKQEKRVKPELFLMQPTKAEASAAKDKPKQKTLTQHQHWTPQPLTDKHTKPEMLAQKEHLNLQEAVKESKHTTLPSKLKEQHINEHLNTSKGNVHLLERPTSDEKGSKESSLTSKPKPNPSNLETNQLKDHKIMKQGKPEIHALENITTAKTSAAKQPAATGNKILPAANRHGKSEILQTKEETEAETHQSSTQAWARCEPLQESKHVCVEEYQDQKLSTKSQAPVAKNVSQYVPQHYKPHATQPKPTNPTVTLAQPSERSTPAKAKENLHAKPTVPFAPVNSEPVTKKTKAPSSNGEPERVSKHLPFASEGEVQAANRPNSADRMSNPEQKVDSTKPKLLCHKAYKDLMFTEDRKDSKNGSVKGCEAYSRTVHTSLPHNSELLKQNSATTTTRTVGKEEEQILTKPLTEFCRLNREAKTWNDVGNINPIMNLRRDGKDTQVVSEGLEYYSVSNCEAEARELSISSPLRDGKTSTDTQSTTAVRSDAFSPSLGKPTMFKVKDNTFRSSPVTKTVKPRFHKTFDEDVATTSSGASEKLDDRANGSEVLTVHHDAITSNQFSRAKEKILPHSVLPADVSVYQQGYFRRNHPLDEEECGSVASAFSDVDSCALSFLDIHDERFGSPKDDEAKPTGKPPVVPPKSEKALRRAKRLATKRTKKDESYPKPEGELQCDDRVIHGVSSMPSSPAELLQPPGPPAVNQFHMEHHYLPPPASNILAQAFPLTQRKLLQDPNSGQYFVVDMPVQVKTKTFFDPQTGKYVQLSVRQPAEARLPHRYLLYPGFLSMPVSSVPALRSMSQMSAPATLTDEPDKPETQEACRPQYSQEVEPYIEPVLGQSRNSRQLNIIPMSELEDFAMEST